VALISAVHRPGALVLTSCKAIAAIHDEPRAEDTIATDPRSTARSSVMVPITPWSCSAARLLAMVHGPQAGSGAAQALDVDGRLSGHHRLDAVRAS
jgi:predicted RNA polymerase sigma factor